MLGLVIPGWREACDIQKRLMHPEAPLLRRKIYRQKSSETGLLMAGRSRLHQKRRADLLNTHNFSHMR
jgi:hypothetical protein